MAFTKVVGAGIHTLSNITSHNINSSGIITATKFVGPIEGDITAVNATFAGNVSIAKTLTYEDVTNVDSVGLGTFRQGIFLPDNKQAKFGNTAASPDLKIYSDGTHQNIVGSAGNFTIKNTTMNATYLSGAYLNLTNAANTQTFLTANANSTRLFHGGTPKLTTTNTGAVVTGILTATHFSGSSEVGIQSGGVQIGAGTVSYTHLTLPTTPYV